MSVGRASLLCLERVQCAQQRSTAPCFRTQYKALPISGRTKAGVKCRRCRRLRTQKVRRYVEDHALIALVRVDLRFVDRALPYKHHIIRPQHMCAPFDDIVSAPGQKEHQLMKFVIMEGRILSQRTAQMEQTVVLMQVSPALIIGLLHVLPPKKHLLQYMIAFLYNYCKREFYILSPKRCFGANYALGVLHLCPRQTVPSLSLRLTDS